MNGFDTGCLATDFAGFFSNKCRDDVGTTAAAAAAMQMLTGQNDQLWLQATMATSFYESTWILVCFLCGHM